MPLEKASLYQSSYVHKYTGMKNGKNNCNPHCPLYFCSRSYWKTGEVTTWLNSKAKARLWTSKEKLKCYEQQKMEKENRHMSKIWSWKFYDPYNFGKVKLNYQGVWTERTENNAISNAWKKRRRCGAAEVVWATEKWRCTSERCSSDVNFLKFW